MVQPRKRASLWYSANRNKTAFGLTAAMVLFTTVTRPSPRTAIIAEAECSIRPALSAGDSAGIGKLQRSMARLPVQSMYPPLATVFWPDVVAIDPRASNMPAPPAAFKNSVVATNATLAVSLTATHLLWHRRQLPAFVLRFWKLNNPLGPWGQRRRGLPHHSRAHAKPASPATSNGR